MNKLVSKMPLVILITLIIQIFNMIKNLLLAKYYGISSNLDAFYLANAFTVTIFNILGIAITTILIPVLSNLDDDDDEAHVGIQIYLTVSYLFVIVSSLLLFLFLYLFKSKIAPSLDNASQYIFLYVVFILLIGQFFRIQTSFSTALLQAKEMFISTKLAMSLTAILPVIYLLFSSTKSIIGLSIVITISYVFESLFLYTSQSKNIYYKYKLKLAKNNVVFKQLVLNTLPIIFSSAIFQFQILFSNYIAGFFGKGYISLLSNTNQIVGMFQVLFVANIISMLYPKLSKEVNENLEKGLNKVTEYISLTNVLIILLTWGYISLGEDLINILFVRGNFSKENAEIIYKFGVFLILALPFSVIRDYCYRFLYSVNKVSEPTKNATLTVVVNIILILFLKQFFGVYSIVIAPLLGTIISTLNILYRMYKLKYRLNLRNIFLNFMIYNIVGYSMLCLIKLIKFTQFSEISNFILNTLISLAYYLLVHFVIKRLLNFKKGV